MWMRGVGGGVLGFGLGRLCGGRLPRPMQSKVEMRMRHGGREEVYLLGTQPSVVNYQSLRLVGPGQKISQRRISAIVSIFRSLSAVCPKSFSIIITHCEVKECAHLDFGLSLLNFATVSISAFLGLVNLIILRISASLPRKKECTNLRAARRERS